MGDSVDTFVARARVLDDDWQPLPEWAGSLARLGGAVANLAVGPGQRPTVALILPTRGFAAVLCAIGAVLQRLSTPDHTAAADRFALLSQLPAGTMVTYRTKTSGARFRGVLVGCDGDSLVVMPSVGSSIRINKHFAHTVEIIGPVGGELPEQASSKPPPSPSALLTELLGQETAVSVRSRSHLDCCIVGTWRSLQVEIVDTRIGLASAQSGIVEGRFHDVLQVRSFSGRSGVFHADVLAAGGGTPVEVRWREPPHVAVFDGANSLLRNGKRWPDARRIVLLDRTDAHLNDAVAEVNGEYLQRTAELPLDLAGLRSSSYEIVAYQARLP